jgi:putative transposase
LIRSERLALLDMYDNRELPLYIQAKLLSLNRSGLYYKPVPISEASLALRHRIDEIYTRWPFYGTRRITAILEHEGYTVNRKAVQRHMRELGLFAICPGPNLSKRNMQHKVYPYLLRGLSITAPDQVWGTDITYIRLAKGWMYLVAILDWYSRFVVAWELSDTLEAGFVKATVARAFERAIPGILNSDQGSQFTCDEYIQLVSSSGVKISMDGRGRAFDNIFTERLWRSVKYEEVYLHDYLSPRDARIGISRYFELYNYSRPHQALNYCTPFDVYSGRTAGLALRV